MLTGLIISEKMSFFLHHYTLFFHKKLERCYTSNANLPLRNNPNIVSGFWNGSVVLKVAVIIPSAVVNAVLSYTVQCVSAVLFTVILQRSRFPGTGIKRNFRDEGETAPRQTPFPCKSRMRQVRNRDCRPYPAFLQTSRRN